MKNNELARMFAEGESDKRTSNMFIEENVIYSYGYHFPIAVRLSHGEYLVNSDLNSRTTNRQVALVKRWIPESKMFEASTDVLKLVIREGFIHREQVEKVANI